MTLVPAGTEVAYTVTYLEMTERPSYDWPSLPAGHTAALLKAENPPVWYFRALYDAVGRDYSWEDLPRQSDAEVADWLDPATKQLWTLIDRGWPQGFFLLDEGRATATEITYFGLVPEAVGTGLGTWLLKTAVLTAWKRPRLEKLEVNTCTLDHPRALQTYQKAGFDPVRREERTRVLVRERDLSRIPD